jgi:hypothetical protein
MSDSAWPALPLEPWKDTRDTLHMYMQVVGKIRLGLSPPEPEFGQVALYLTARGLTTGPMPYGDINLQIDFDFIGHQLYFATSDGRLERLALTPRSVRDFYADVLAALRTLNIDVAINPKPQEVQDPIPFPEDVVHASYDASSVNAFWRILSSVDSVFKAFRAPYRGRHTPVNVWWGSCDLAYARYSGRAASPPPNSGYIMRHSMDAEEVAAGFWAGDGRYPAPAFYAYVYPKPDGIENATIRPPSASWNATLGEFLLPYESVRKAPSPEAEILEFLESTYQTGRRLGNWPPS